MARQDKWLKHIVKPVMRKAWRLMMIENSIGLEAEFFLRNEKNELVLPSEHKFPCDDFLLLGEIRGTPGKTREETVSNFLKEFYRLHFLAEKSKLRMDIEEGWLKLDPKFYTSVVKKIEQKAVPKCQNIHDYDLSSYSDSIVENGKLMAHKVSIGLHIHFGSVEKDTKEFVKKKYDNIKLPLNVSSVETYLNLFAERGEEKVKVECSCSRITKPAIQHIVAQMDKEVHSKFKIAESLRYRLPGFYETKTGGRFEYRSLPFNKKVLQDIPRIVDFSYELLENL